MERKIGEIFEYEGKRLVAKETNIGSCTDCFFKLIGCTSQAKGNIGACSSMTRTDNKSVIFVQVTEGSEKQQAEQPQKLNLCEILKYCPQGETFWSPMLGDVALYDIDNEKKRVYVLLKTDIDIQMYINADATLTLGDVTSQEIMLYPSREQRDWAKVKYPRKERFDPKTLNPFDRVLVNHDDIWKIDFFSHICQYEPNGWCQCIGDSYYICIPYNDETKYLLGTKEEAPEYYRYWED